MRALPDTGSSARFPGRSSWWSQVLGKLPNQKFAVTEEIYRRTELVQTADAASIAAANVEFTYRYYARLERLRHGATRQRLHAAVDDSGADDLHTALRTGRGVVLVSAHLGDFDVAGSWIAQRLGREVVVISNEVPEAVRQRWFEDVRRKSGVLLRRSNQTRFADVQSDLRRGRVVLFMIDRLTPGPALEGCLLGQPAQLPVAPYALARQTGATLICGTTTTERDGRRLLTAQRPGQAAEDRHDASSVVSAAADILSRHIRRCPWQWHVPADVRELPFAASSNMRTPIAGGGGERVAA
jgi:KDO2-lipid IV(A) lauroyltransferase